MKEPALFLGISLVLTSIVVWIFANSEKVRQARVKEMAHRYAANHPLDNLEIKRAILADELDLDSVQESDNLEAINLALDWQRKHSRADVPTTPQNQRGI